MIPEYQFLHGALLHEIITACKRGVSIRELDNSGRVNAFLLDGSVGLLIKHSGARLSPWVFTFTGDNLAELQLLNDAAAECFVGFVCNEDGFVCLSYPQLKSVLNVTPGGTLSIRIERPPRKMYRVSCGGSDLQEKLPSGAEAIVNAITKRSS